MEEARVHDEAGKEFLRLLEIMDRLRGEGGCEWDRAQTHESLRQYLVEEAYEVVESIDAGDNAKLADELGDLMLHIVFHAKMGKESGSFDIESVLRGINEKLKRRHPHVFKGMQLEGAEEIVRSWEEIKFAEGRKSRLEGVPEILPALQKALRLQEKASGVGFDWGEIAPVWEKVKEELAELAEAEESGETANIEEEVGDLLFSIVNLSRFLGVNAEDALRGTIRKFEARFRGIEEHARINGKELKDMTLTEMDEVWERSKEGTRNDG